MWYLVWCVGCGYWWWFVNWWYYRLVLRLVVCWFWVWCGIDFVWVMGCGENSWCGFECFVCVVSGLVGLGDSYVFRLCYWVVVGLEVYWWICYLLIDKGLWWCGYILEDWVGNGIGVIVCCLRYFCNSLRFFWCLGLLLYRWYC